MRLLKIGSSPDCDIVLNSRKVSYLHAELIMLNNGDILLEDKGSTNGTFVNNQLVRQGASVTVRRGDLIRFGDTELQWSAVPQPTNNSMFKKIYGIGSPQVGGDFRRGSEVPFGTAGHQKACEGPSLRLY